MGQEMKNIGTLTKKTTTGFTQTITRYQAQNCEGCPLRGVCHKAQGNMVIEINHNLNRLKQQADELLVSEEGVKHRRSGAVMWNLSLAISKATITLNALCCGALKK